jgi:membrane protease YdiL (CAAX protease family)
VEYLETSEPVQDEAPSPPDDRPSVVRRIFRNCFGHWRAGWRVVAYLIAVLVIGKAITTPLKLIVPNVPESEFLSWTHTLMWVVGNVALIVAGLILLRFFDRRPLSLLGIGFSRGWAYEFVGGLVAGVVVTGVLAAILVATGSVSMKLTPDLGASLGALPFFLTLFTLAAALEEFVFRGYPLQALGEGSRNWIAGLFLCVLFTLAHADNPDVTMIGIANIFLAGVILVILYYQTRRLWLPITFHLSWNLAQSWLWGFDVSGIKIENQLFVTTPTGPDLLTGGEFGLEGSILSTILFVAVSLWFLARPLLRPTEEVAALWARYPAGFGLEPVSRSQEPADEEQGGRGEEGLGGEPESRVEF